MHTAASRAPSPLLLGGRLPRLLRRRRRGARQAAALAGDGAGQAPGREALVDGHPRAVHQRPGGVQRRADVHLEGRGRPRLGLVEIKVNYVANLGAAAVNDPVVTVKGQRPAGPVAQARLGAEILRPALRFLGDWGESGRRSA